MTSHRYKGNCHCGNIQLEFLSARPPSEFRPRSCDCSFCLKHGATYVSDPAGSLVITVREQTELNRYRQGSKSAEFLVCKTCGVLAAVMFSEDAGLYAAVNCRVIEHCVALGQDMSGSPRLLGAGEKSMRWKALWFADVSIV